MSDTDTTSNLKLIFYKKLYPDSKEPVKATMYANGYDLSVHHVEYLPENPSGAKMWFLGYLAFQDAYNLSTAWVEPWKELWKEADELVEQFTKPMLKKYPRELQEATRVWCCISSPYRHPELEAWIMGETNEKKAGQAELERVL